MLPAVHGARARSCSRNPAHARARVRPADGPGAAERRRELDVRPLGSAGDREGRGRHRSRPGDAIPLRARRPRRPNATRQLRGAFGFVIWSHDGQRAAWCTPARASTSSRRRLAAAPRCPAATRRPARSPTRREPARTRPGARAGVGADHGRPLRRGRLVAVVVDGRRSSATRDAGGRASIPERSRADADLSPDNCTAAFRAARPDRSSTSGAPRIEPPAVGPRARDRLVARRRVDRVRRPTSDAPLTSCSGRAASARRPALGRRASTGAAGERRGQLFASFQSSPTPMSTASGGSSG